MLVSSHSFWFMFGLPLLLVLASLFHDCCAGAGIYVADRTPRALSNNTALYHSCTSCRLTIYCYSNSTSRINTAVITTPHQGDVFSYSSYRDPISIARVSPSGIRLLYQNNYYTRTSGTYICRIPDSEGNQVHLSFGLHFTSASNENTIIG